MNTVTTWSQAAVLFLAGLGLLICAGTYYLVRWLDSMKYEDEIAGLTARNGDLASVLDRIVRRHDFMTPHAGETCEEHGCLISVQEARGLVRRNQ